MDSANVEYMRLGVLDIGSNSVRFVIYEIFGASFTPVYNEKVLAGLGRDLRSTGELSPNGKREALAAIQRFKMIASSQKLDRILVGATAALRMATDAPAFIAKILALTGLDITPVSGREEARLTALGLIAAQPRAKGIAADLGGASLELIPIDDGKVAPGVSYPIGPFQVVGHNLADESPLDVDGMRKKINDALDETPIDPRPGEPLYLIGGAWRNLAKIHQERHLYPMRTLQAYALMPGAAKDLAKWAYGPGHLDVLNWPGLNRRRAETLPYGGLLLDVLLSRLNPPQIIISTTGLREGLVYDSLPPELRSRDSLLDGCRDLARGNLQGLHLAQPLAEFLKPIESLMPRAFEPTNEARLRRAACHLAGIGKGLHPDYRAALVFEEVLYAPLAGLTHKERAYLAMILFHSYTSDGDVPNAGAINLLLSLKERNAAKIYGTGIRLGVVASGQSADLLREFSLTYEDEILFLGLKSSHGALATDRVAHRLRKFGNLLDTETEIRKNFID